VLSVTRIIRALLRGIASNKVALTGAILTTVLFPILVVYAVLDGMDLVNNPKMSFVVYGGLTWLFIAGHLMVFAGLFVIRNKSGFTLFSAADFNEHFSERRRFTSIRKLILVVTAITFVNLLVIGASAYNGFLYSESTDFCGRLCHGVMMPEMTAYGNSPHSRVECVECHIGEGATWFVRSKLSGINQAFAVVLDTYSQPIETPIHGLRPARETCEECHRPELFHGERLRVKDKFLVDEMNTHVRTVLLMKVGSGDQAEKEGQGSHWHVSREKEIFFEHTDRKRMNISAVRLVNNQGHETTFLAGDDSPPASNPDEGDVRRMDCLDCHNRPTHIYRNPDEALDEKLMSRKIPRELPFIKKKGMELIQREFDSQSAGADEISRSLRAWYQANYPALVSGDPLLLERAIEGVSQAYLENVFPEMKVGFGTYEKHLGHSQDGGCFRCHDDSHRTGEGEVISQDCELCHVVLAVEEPVAEATAAVLSVRP
jgi:hypothetical protein